MKRIHSGEPRPTTSRGGDNSNSFSQNTAVEITAVDHQLQKLTLKNDYLTLLDNANEIVGSGSTAKTIQELEKVVNQANELFTHVNDTAEMFLDAQVFQSTSTAVKQVSNNLDVGEGKFNLLVFAEQLKIMALDDEGEPSWQVLAAQAEPINFDSLPHFSPLLASFEFTVEERPVKEKRRPREKDIETEKREPEKLTEIQNTDKGTEKLVQDIFKKLKRIYRKNGQKPISYFRFVVDPTSFSATVENIFHVSFLVHDDAVKLELDDDVGILISPSLHIQGRENLDPERGSQESNRKELKQSIMSIDMKLWKALITMLQIENAMI